MTRPQKRNYSARFRESAFKLFHWQFSSVLIPFFAGMGVGMIGIGSFQLARLCFTVAAIWSAGFWLTCDTLQTMRKRIGVKRQARDQQRRRHLLNVYRLWKWLVMGGIVALLWVSLRLVDAYDLDSELRKLSGKLFPAADKTPDNPCKGVPQGGVLLFMGDMVFAVTHFPHTMLAVEGHSPGELTPIVRLDRDASGVASLLLDVRSADGRIVTRITEDGFVVNQNNFLEMLRPDISTLSVVDQTGSKVLWARYLNRNAIRLDGAVTVPSLGVVPLQTNVHDGCIVTGNSPNLVDIVLLRH